MPGENILKGVFKEGGIVASVIQKEGHARAMVKGAEPGDPAFAEQIGKVAAACKAHLQDYPERELCAVVGIKKSKAGFPGLEVTEGSYTGGA